MNIPFHKLHAATRNGLINYYPKCKESELTHLCFANDLLIFSNGSPHSINGILEVLGGFQLISGLAISREKSCFFSCELLDDEVATISSISDSMCNAYLWKGSLKERFCAKISGIQ